MEIFSNTNHENIDLSIVIPMFNVADYIVETLDSMRSVCNYNIELVLVDDGSTDNTLELAKNWAAQNQIDCRIFSKENEGPSIARNLGISESRGEYVTFFDSDDIALSYLYNDILSVMKTHGVELAIFRGCSFDHVTQDVYEFPDYYVWDKIMGGAEVKILSPHQEPRIARLEPSAVIRVFKRDFMINNSLRFPEGLFFEDILIHAKCVLKAKKIALLNKTLLMYRINRDGQTTGSFGKKRQDILKVLDSVINEYKNKEVADDIWANLIGLLLRMTVWCSENCAYEDKKEFVKKSVDIFKRVPQDIISDYMKNYSYGEWEYNICAAYLKEDLDVLYVAAEGGFPTIASGWNASTHTNIQRPVDIALVHERVEQLISQQRDGWAHDRFNVLNAKIDRILNSRAILSRVKNKIKNVVSRG